MSETRKKIAIVGSGISGMACAHFLHPHHDLTLFEKDSHIGGHSNTVMAGKDPLDTGFMVYNEATYPLLTRLFKDLDVATKPTSMSFSVQHTHDGLEFNGGSLNLLFGQRKNLFRPRFWKMLLQINRFNKETVAELQKGEETKLTLAEYVDQRGYGQDFLRWYLAPMAAAVWSSPPEKIEQFPAITLMRFWHNHGFLGLDTQHPWRTVVGGSKEYVKKLTAPFADRIRKGDPVVSISPDNEVTLTSGTKQSFDRIVSAAHGDQALALLAEPTALEQDFLSAFPYQPNKAVLHTDEQFMPKNRRCWASWNYRVDHEKHSTIYWMNSLQGATANKNFFVSINPSAPIPKKHVIKELDYEHPLFDLQSIAAQKRIPDLHEAGTGRYYCGAWQRYGFHEDGLWSAVRLCEHLLGRSPWS
ncbi:MAG: FAD-dependent oxidoreductase [Akkermansiaceae bacterium]|nr:FAD-dependent oxidoreductase [Akkermansiaceae bacterium]